MSVQLLKKVSCPVMLFWACFQFSLLMAAETGGPPPQAPMIPGITGEDQFPLGCVSCHINMPDRGMDTRFSTLMKQLAVNVAPNLLAKAQAASPAGLVLKGIHPVPGSIGIIPGSCLKCHGRDSRVAPPFGRLMHLIHLADGNENHFLALFQGECTHCHKVDLRTGALTIGSGVEK